MQDDLTSSLVSNIYVVFHSVAKLLTVTKARPKTQNISMQRSYHNIAGQMLYALRHPVARYCNMLGFLT